MKNKMLELFKKVYGDTENVEVYFAPGRVNLIGEHTDYNGGHVFPCALTMGTYMAARKNGTDTCNFYSDNYASAGKLSVKVSELANPSNRLWINYPVAVMNAYEFKGYKMNEGFDAVYFGNIPSSSGLSSSAAVEVVTAFALNNLFGFDVNNVDISLYTQFAENKYIGVNCGIMDQFSSAMGKKDNAIFLDTNSLEYEYVKVSLTGAKIVLANTNKQRGLGDSKYNERRSQCETALADLQKELDIKALGELDEAQFEANRHLIKDPVCAQRAKHAVYENRRTIKAVEVLKNNDIAEFGRLMNASHVSLRDDYEVTGVELDTLVSAAWEVEGTIGARMTGAGFGGCTVAIVKDEAVDKFISTVGEKYKKAIGYEASFYIAEIGNGPYVLA